MDAPRRAARLQQLRRLGWAWSIFVCAVGTVGGVIGWVGIENDRT